MSCGNPHDVDCGEVLRHLQEYLDNEADDASCAEVRQHLDECAPCLKEHGVYDEVKKLVGRCCGGEVASDQLRQKIYALTVEQVSVEVITVEAGDL